MGAKGLGTWILAAAAVLGLAALAAAQEGTPGQEGRLPAAAQAHIVIMSDGQNVTVIRSDGGEGVVVQSGQGGAGAPPGPGGGIRVSGSPMGFGEIGQDGKGALRLLRDEGVRTELALTADQAALIQDLIKDGDTIMADMRKGFSGDAAGTEDLTPEERRQRMRERMAQMAETWRTKGAELAELDKIAWEALTEVQRGKLRELAQARTRSVMRRGIASILGEEAVKELNLSDAQVDQIRGIIQESAQEAGRLWRERVAGLQGLSPEERHAKNLEFSAKMGAERAEREAAVKAKVMAVLTPEQRDKAEAYLKEAEARRGTTVGRAIRPPAAGTEGPPPPPPTPTP
jgi:hypothetical protein